MTEIMMTIVGKFDASTGQVIGYAKGAFALCMLIDFIWTLLSDLEQDYIKLLLRRCMYYGIYSFCLDSSGEWAKQIKESFIIIGQTVGGGAANLNDPSSIVQDAMTGLNSGWNSMLKNLSISMDISASVKSVMINLLGIIFLVIMFLCYLFIALNIVVQNVLWSLIVPLMIPLLGFGVMQKTSFLAQTAISSILSLSARFAVLAAIIGVCSSFLSGYQPIDIKAENVMVIFLEQLVKVGTVAVLVWMAPSMAAGFFAGSAPTLGTTGAIASTARAGLSAATAAATGGAMGAAAGAKSSFMAAGGGSGGTQAILAAAGGAIKGGSQGAGQALTAHMSRQTGAGQVSRDLHNPSKPPPSSGNNSDSGNNKKYTNPRGK